MNNGVARQSGTWNTNYNVQLTYQESLMNRNQMFFCALVFLLQINNSKICFDPDMSRCVICIKIQMYSAAFLLGEWLPRNVYFPSLFYHFNIESIRTLAEHRDCTP